MQPLRLDNKVALLLLALLHGGAATLSLAPFNYPLLCWIAPWPLFCLAGKFRHSVFKLALAGMVCAFFVSLFAFNWLFFYLDTLGKMPFGLHLFLFLAYSVLLNLKIPAFLVLFGIGRRLKWRPWMPPAWLAAGVFGMVADLLAPQIFPWYWGNLLAGNPCYVQLAEYTGVYGLSFLLFAGSYWLYRACGLVASSALAGRRLFFRCLSSGYVRRRLLPLPLSLLALLVAGAALKQAAWQYQRSLPTVRVALLQPNAPLEMSGIHEVPQARIDRIIQRTIPELAGAAHRGAEGELDLIVLPESAVPYYSADKRSRSKHDDIYCQAFDQMARRLAKQWRTEVYLNEVILAPGAGGKADRYYNASVLYAIDGQRRGTYRKQILIAFGEYIPFERLIRQAGLFRLVPDAVSEVYGRGQRSNLIAFGHAFRSRPAASIAPRAAGEKAFQSKENVSSAADRRQAASVRGYFLPLICYEILFPGFVRSFRDGSATPGFIVNQTQDGWFGDSMESFQHFELGRIRAIETRRAVVRCTNSGTSGFVDLAGDYAKPLAGPVFTPQGTEAFQVWDVPVNRGEATFYTCWGERWMVLPVVFCLVPAGRRLYRKTVEQGVIPAGRIR